MYIKQWKKKENKNKNEEKNKEKGEKQVPQLKNLLYSHNSS